MSSMPTQFGLNFIGRYDTNRDGLSKQELQQGQMMSYMQAMFSMMSGNQAGFMSSMQDLQFASMANQNFDILSNATNAGPYANNSQNITPHDLMKTASNDGNRGNITRNDIASQQQQNQMPPFMQMMMQFMQMMMQMIMQMMGMNPQQQMGFGNQGNQQNYNNPSQFAGSYGNNGGATATATAGPGGASASASAGGSNSAGYVGQSNQPNAPVNSYGLASPVQGGRVSSEYGMRTHPITGRRKMHSGMDIAAPKGTGVSSMANGKVTFAGKRGGYGNMIIVDHGNGITTRYAHLNSINVQRGQSVNAGQHIGGVGSTGHSTGNHLHFEVRENGNSVNPRKYINP